MLLISVFEKGPRASRDYLFDEFRDAVHAEKVWKIKRYLPNVSNTSFINIFSFLLQVYARKM